MNIIKASGEFKFQLCPQGYVSPTFKCFNFNSKEEFIGEVHKKIEEFPYLLAFDGGECLLYLDNEDSKQLFYDCLSTYWDNYSEKELNNAIKNIIKYFKEIPINKRELILKELEKLCEKDHSPDYLNIEL